jgi:predicted amino acid-binding ACT domain protein
MAGALRVQTHKRCRPVCLLPHSVRAARLSVRASRADISASPQNNTPPGKSMVYAIDNESSDIYTCVSVKGENRPGLLSAITSVFAGIGVDVQKAEVATQGTVVDDTFYIVDASGKKIKDTRLLGSIEAALNAIVEGQVGSTTPTKQRRPSFDLGTETGSIKTELMSMFLLFIALSFFTFFSAVQADSTWPSHFALCHSKNGRLQQPLLQHHDGL